MKRLLCDDTHTILIDDILSIILSNINIPRDYKTCTLVSRTWYNTIKCPKREHAYMCVIDTLVARHPDIKWNWRVLASHVTEKTFEKHLETLSIGARIELIKDAYSQNDDAFIAHLSNKFIDKYDIPLHDIIFQNYSFLGNDTENLLSLKSIETIIDNRGIQMHIITWYIAVFDDIDWQLISAAPCLTRDFITSHNERLYWGHLSSNRALTMDLVEKYQDKLDWYEIAYNPNLTPEFIDANFNKFISKSIFNNDGFTMELVEKYYDKLNWSYLSFNKNLTVACIRENWDKLRHDYISGNPNLTSELIREYAGDLFWPKLMTNRALMLDVAEENIWRLRNVQ